ncbi:hypothetical protein [Curtanaerobium respiraculi]|uniref:hypothetical protein n=1 Tax=Curtanaerobium respiraculi TaxID=2949669 RepID=UPI0024B34927|nr:hypothetical protein [Curtanaerobium respiraculi]
MALPVILGFMVGALGFIPLIGAVVAVRHVTKVSNFSHASILLLAVAGSTAVLLGGALICIAFFRESALPFVGGEAAGLLAAALVFVVRKRLTK